MKHLKPTIFGRLIAIAVLSIFVFPAQLRSYHVSLAAPNLAPYSVFLPIVVQSNLFSQSPGRTRTPAPPTPTNKPETATPTTNPILPTATNTPFTPTPTPILTTEPGILTYTGGDWERGIVGDGLWHWIEVRSSDRITRVTSPVRQGTYAALVVVRPGDSANGGERSEVSLPSNNTGNILYENESTDYEYVGFSIMLPTDWQPPTGDTNTWGVAAQLHGPDTYGASPAWSLHVESNIYIEMTAGDMDHMTWIDYPLSNPSLNRGRWIDFVVKLVFSKTNGAFTLWRRDEGETSFTVVAQMSGIPTLQYKSSQGGVVLDHYWKYGFYRNPQNPMVSTLWLDGFTIGKSFQAVAAAAFAGVR